MPSDFWDHLKEQLSSVPPDFSCALELLKEVREVSAHLHCSLEVPRPVSAGTSGWWPQVLIAKVTRQPNH